LRREESKLRLADWQNDPALCSLASKVLANPDLQLMLSVMKNEHPSKIALRLGVPMDDRVVQQARAEGYEMFLANLEALAILRRPIPMPEAMFEPELPERV
jgi:hypothetical protein